MATENADLAYLWDIREAAQDIINFTQNIEYADFENNKLVRFAVERQLLVIGEAAKKISNDTRQLTCDIPWSKIVGLRNVIAHDYGEILTERIWVVATEDIPDLYVEIDKMILNLDK